MMKAATHLRKYFESLCLSPNVDLKRDQLQMAKDTLCQDKELIPDERHLLKGPILRHLLGSKSTIRTSS